MKIVAADMHCRSCVPALLLLLRIVVFASLVPLIDSHQYFEGIYCGEDNCYECECFDMRFYISVFRFGMPLQ